MTVHVVHFLGDRDSDTGHSTFYTSEVQKVFSTLEAAEKFVSEYGAKRRWYSGRIKSVEVEE